MFLTICVIVFVPLAICFYQFKQASADGRKLIWKISLNMIADKPVFGFGYGRFEPEYNLYQAKYFNEGLGTNQEKANASFVRMAYNEFLENTVDGGITGLLLFAGIIISLLIKTSSDTEVKEEKKHSKASLQNSDLTVSDNLIIQTSAYGGIAAFAVMSVCNFTVQAVPVMCLFILYAAVRTTNPAGKIKGTAQKSLFDLQVIKNIRFSTPVK